MLKRLSSSCIIIVRIYRLNKNNSCRLKKGCTYSWDLMIIGVINGVFTFFGLPMVHGALPHSPLHARALADLEDYVEQGHVYQK